jgi:hypothetical protein
MGFNIGGGIGGYFGNQATNAAIAANNRLSLLNAKVSNALRQASNAAKSAEGNLQRFVQSVNNNKRLDAGGSALEALVVNGRRRMDANLSGNLSSDIRTAEQAGHAAAAAAAAGIDGNVVDMVNQSTALRDSIVKNSVDKAQSAANYDLSVKAGHVMSQMVSSLDNSVIMDSIDYNVDVAQERPETSSFAALVRGAFPAALDASLGAPSYNGGKTQSTDNAASWTAANNRRSANAESAGLSEVQYNENYGNEGRNNKATYNPDYGNEGRRDTSLWDTPARSESSDGYNLFSR